MYVIGLNSFAKIYIMKLYFDSIKPSQIVKYYLNDVKKTTKSIKTIISEEGIFHINLNNIERVMIQDVPIEKISLLDLEATIDKSTIKPVETVYQIPFSHYMSDWKYSYYSLRPNALVQFVIGEINNEIKDVYFKIKENQITSSIEQDIHAFLTKLKLC